METVRFWNHRRSRPILGDPITGSGSQIRSISFAPSGKTIVTGDVNGQIKVWTTETNTPAPQSMQGHAGKVNDLTFIPDSKILVSGSDDKTVRLWDTVSGTQIGPTLTGHSGAVETTATCLKENLIASGDSEGEIRIWNSETGRLIRRFSAHGDPVTGISFHFDGQILASFSHKTVKFWKSNSGLKVYDDIEESFEISAVAFSPITNLLAVGGYGDDIHLWDIKTGRSSPRILASAGAWITDLQFNPKGDLLASTGVDGRFGIWNIDSAEKILAAPKKIIPFSCHGFSGRGMGSEQPIHPHYRFDNCKMESRSREPFYLSESDSSQ